VDSVPEAFAMTAAAGHAFDVCKCGDYRHQHVGGTGRCLLGSLCTPYPCQRFRFFCGPSTFCCGCRAHFPVGEDGEFVWDGTNEKVGI
jgi:hypothetical protein